MYRIGVDLGGTKIDGILMGADGDIEHEIRIDTPTSYFDTVKAIHAMVSELDKIANGIYPVGLGTPGAWVAETGAMKNCNSTNLNGKPLLHDMQKLLNRPVRIANDANCMVLSEAIDGAGQDGECVFGVIIGTGVGGGVVVKRHIVGGPNLLAGEWGHNPFPVIPRNSSLRLNPGEQVRDCYCGRVNCIETFLSGRGLERSHLELHGEVLDAPTIGRGESDKTLATVNEYIEQLAIALATIVNILDPDVIVLAGGLSNIEHIYGRLPELIQKYAFSSEGRTRVRKPKYGDASGRRGAAWLFPATANS